MYNIPFSPPDMTDAEVRAAAEAIKSGWITTGPKVKEFERKIADFCHTERAVCLNSATAAMEMTLRVLGIGAGDEVITTAYTYTASASVIDHVGAKIVLVDCGKDSFEIDYDSIAGAITHRTKAIIAVDLGGVMCDYDRIYEIIEAKKSLFAPSNDLQKAFGRVVVISDAAHAFGAQRKGKICGEVADFTSFSFHAVKNLTTAEGGAVVWRNIEGVDNDRLYRQYQLLSLHGQQRDALEKAENGGWEYDIISLSYKCNMTDVTAAIGLAQLERYPALLKKRFEIIEKYNEAMRKAGIDTLSHKGEDFTSSGHLYLTTVKGIDGAQREAIIQGMQKKGITCNVHYKPLPMMTGYKKLGFDIRNYPNAKALFEKEITLPLHTRLTDEEVSYIAESYVECVNAVRGKTIPANKIEEKATDDKMNEKIWLSTPTTHTEEMEFIKEAFDTNWVAPLGKNVNEFENELAAYVGSKSAAAVTAGTHALHLAIKLAGVGEGDIVLCSDLTFAATVNPVSYEKATQVFIDSERETWNMDPVALKNALEKYGDRVKAVMVANLYGTPARLDEIAALCEEYGVVLIEDAAESLGATYKNKQTGTFGKYNAVSFNGNKIITSSGGGMLLSDCEEDIKKARFWSTQARDPAPWYQHSEIGYNYRMSNIVAGVGRGQLIHLDEHIALKKAIYKRYEEGLKGLPVSMNPYTKDCEPNFWLSCLIIDEDALDRANPEKIRLALEAENIESRPIWKPMHLQPVFEGYDFVTAAGEDVGKDIFDRGLCLPSDIKMTEEQQNRVIEIIRNCF